MVLFLRLSTKLFFFLFYQKGVFDVSIRKDNLNFLVSYWRTKNLVMVLVGRILFLLNWEPISEG